MVFGNKVVKPFAYLAKKQNTRNGLKIIYFLRNIWIISTSKIQNVLKAAMADGYVLNGFTEPSQKLESFQMRRIFLKKTGETYAIRLTEVMPYMIATTKAVEKALILKQICSSILP